MPFGLSNAPATFQRLMDGIFRDHIGEDIAAFIEQLLMYALQFPEIFQVFDRTLGQLIVAVLNCKSRKFQMFPAGIQ